MAPKKRRRKEVENGTGEASDGQAKSKRLGVNSANVDLLQKAYGINFPDDLYELWNFCLEIEKKTPLKALSDIGLNLVGPFEVLADKIKPNDANPVNLHLRWRFFYDPPEVMTLLTSKNPNNDMFHIAYLRDEPNDEKCVVVSNNGKDCTINILGDNLFCALHRFLCDKLSSAKGKEKAIVKNLSEKLYEFAKSRQININAQDNVSHRSKKVVDKTFHGAGIVVPIDENEVGYRPVAETPAKLKKMFKRIDEADNDDMRMVAFDPLQEIVTYVQLANDECDFGMGLELGINMFCYGSRYLNKAACRMLSMAYSLLNRGLYQKIIEQHLSDRRNENFSRS